MISNALRGTLVEAVGALTPCPWLYIALGAHLLREMGSIPEDHPYADWLKMYSDPAFNEYWTHYHGVMERRGVSPDWARRIVRTRPTVIGALMVAKGEADGAADKALSLLSQRADQTTTVQSYSPAQRKSRECLTGMIAGSRCARASNRQAPLVLERTPAVWTVSQPAIHASL
jgi:hypothetical protein